MALPPERVASVMLRWHDLELISCKELQTLWAGYGHICAITVRATTDDAAKRLQKLYPFLSLPSTSTYPLILKVISAPSSGLDAHDEGHLRKMLSYDVEQYFYSEVAPKLPDDVAVAKCLATTRGMSGRPGEDELKGLTATIMTDLQPEFPVAGEKRAVLNQTQVMAALDWLSKFHRQSWNDLPTADLADYVRPPLVEAQMTRPEKRQNTKLWLNGGYTYLETRRKEYSNLEEDTESEWADLFCKPEKDALSITELAAAVLTPRGRAIESYIHGDVKSENLFTTSDGTSAAFFDFQYVGLGLGVCDLAKLFTCSVPLRMLVDTRNPITNELTMGDGERQLLEQYRAVLLAGELRSYEWEEFKLHWETALVDWCRFQASWGFWGNTEWLQARVRSICNDRAWTTWIKGPVTVPTMKNKS